MMSVHVVSRGALRATRGRYGCTSPTSTNFLLQLPGTCRTFHVSPRSQFGLEPIISSTHTIIDGLHSVTGLPWAAVIPLTAVLVRTCIGLPLAIYARKNTQKQWDLAPLMSAWSVGTHLATHRQMAHLGPAAISKAAAKKLRIKRREVFKRWGCQFWKGFLPGASLFVWLPVMETIRNMSGVKAGLLGLIVGKNLSRGEAASTALASTEGVELLPDTGSVAAFSGHITQFFEPTLATEGALWFPDLTASDPLLLLPFILSASMFLNLMKTGRAANTSTAKPSAFQRGLTNTLKIFALAIGPLTLDMPTAMLIYWTTSMTAAFLQNVALDMYMPLRPPVTPCRPQTARSPLEPNGGDVK